MDEVKVGVLWAEALRANVTDPQIAKAFLIIVANEMSADIAGYVPARASHHHGKTGALVREFSHG